MGAGYSIRCSNFKCDYEKICLQFWKELPLGSFRIRQNVVFDGERGPKRNVHIRYVLCLVYEKQMAGTEETKYN